MKNFKKYLAVFLLLITTLIFTGCSLSSVIKNDNTNSAETADNYKNLSDENLLKVHYIDVGQADCILVQQGEHNMLIDAGNRDDQNKISDYLNKHNIKNFDYVIATHPHEDHIGSMAYIVKNYDIKTIYAPKKTTNTKVFENFAEEAQKKGLGLTAPKPGDKFKLGNAECEILAPNNSEYSSLNDYSIVLKIKYKDKSFLFTGDAEKLSENEILDKGFDVKADVLKAGHHGSRTSSGTEFIKAVNPETAVISVGKDNKYKLPNTETLDTLAGINAKVLRTDELGDIILESDGKTIVQVSSNGVIESLDKDKKLEKNTENNSQKKEEAAIDTEDKSEKVYVTKSGKAYHKNPECSFIKDKETEEISLEEAQNKGLNPCKKCSE